nr:protein arginine N-methyltransferase 9-like [Procambarus clarkii]XP_045584915.1 protein arginine N-methyltransferase 9-like [Procambarus clarkii]XP_045584923.1 protein arginine N-methyltransferase 9-like [Procambarus clarkii]XP_045584932.1 protein arginine N-methyltransferase 9-like [Procambarus clarkii]
MPGRPIFQGLDNGRSKTSLLARSQVAERHLQAFELCQQRGEIGQSFSHLSLVLCILPNLKAEYYSTYLQVFEDWIGKVEENNGFQEAMTIFEVAFNHYPESPDLHHLLAKILYRHGSVHEAWNHACLAQVECPRDPNVQETRSRLTNALVDRWHLPMINDSTRNSAFKLAIEKAVEQGHHSVLDIGSGTGLLSIFAKRAHAREVYACEVDKFMCELSNSILQANMDPPVIHVLNQHSTDIIIASHIPQKVSLVVSEIMDAGLFGEHILTTLEHAWKHLLLPPKSSVMPHESEVMSSLAQKPETSVKSNFSTQVESSSETSTDPLEVMTADRERLLCRKTDPLSSEFGKVIPAKAEVFFALISCDYIAKQSKVHRSDLSYFRNKNVCIKLQEPYMSEKLSQVPGGFKLLSKWTHLTTVDFNSLDDIEKHLTGKVNKTLKLHCTENGPIDAIIIAFKLYMDEEHYIDTFPDTGNTLWENAVYPVTNLISAVTQNIITVDFKCSGVIKLSIQDSSTTSKHEDCFYLSENAIRFLNSKKFVNCFLCVAQEMVMYLHQAGRNKAPRKRPIIICDTTPFPVAGLAVQSAFPNSKLYVEDDDIKNALNELGIIVHLCEDLEEKIDVLFMWPITKEGTLKDGLVKNIIMYRLMMARDGLVYPQEIDLVVSIISSPALAAMTRVHDQNTCDVKVAEVFNIVKTTHHLDVPLSAISHATVIQHPVPVVRLSLVSSHAEPLGPLREELGEENASLLVLGGEVVNVLTNVLVTDSSTITAVPYWFHIRGELPQKTKVSSKLPSESTSELPSLVPSGHSTTPHDNIVLSTNHPDSPCNQSLFVLNNPLEVLEGENVSLDVVWREGVFHATVEIPEVNRGE